jgi:hypothetical protein
MNHNIVAQKQNSFDAVAAGMYINSSRAVRLKKVKDWCSRTGKYVGITSKLETGN